MWLFLKKWVLYSLDHSRVSSFLLRQYFFSVSWIFSGIMLGTSGSYNSSVLACIIFCLGLVYRFWLTFMGRGLWFHDNVALRAPAMLFCSASFTCPHLGAHLIPAGAIFRKSIHFPWPVAIGKDTWGTSRENFPARQPARCWQSSCSIPADAPPSGSEEASLVGPVPLGRGWSLGLFFKWLGSRELPAWSPPVLLGGEYLSELLPATGAWCDVLEKARTWWPYAIGITRDAKPWYPSSAEWKTRKGSLCWASPFPVLWSERPYFTWAFFKKKNLFLLVILSWRPLQHLVWDIWEIKRKPRKTIPVFFLKFFTLTGQNRKYFWPSVSSGYVFCPLIHLDCPSSVKGSFPSCMH